MLRLTGGLFRGRMIDTLNTERVRPTQARLRQALFNSLTSLQLRENQIQDNQNSQDLDEQVGIRVLDLFAGSGALGFEALSRGAATITFVENNRSTIKLIERNAAALDVRDKIKIIGESLENIGKLGAKIKADLPFDVIMADPPYTEGWEMRLLNEIPWDEWLRVGGYLFIEWGRVKSQVNDLPEKIQCLEKIREKIYGESVLTTYATRI